MKRAVLRRWWRRSRIGTVTIVIVMILAASLVAVGTLELILQVRARILHAMDHSEETRIVDGYEPFVSEHLHPTFLFGPPLTDAARRAANNAVCSVDAMGFRGPGIEKRDQRPLAFLLGGSVAFGLLASSDDTTITSYLNRLQDRYYFVNAGYPGFNTTQELIRLTADVANYKPALVVALNGWNDANLTGERWWLDEGLPAGIPGPYPTLVDIVRTGPPPLFDVRIETVIPEIWSRWLRWRPDTTPAPPENTDEGIRAGVQRYVANIRRAQLVAAAIGARYVAVFQPLLSLHRHAAPDYTADPAVTRFHRMLADTPVRGVEFLDFSDLFDRYQNPVRADRASNTAYFADDGHFNDRGNEVVARELLAGLGIAERR